MMIGLNDRNAVFHDKRLVRIDGRTVEHQVKMTGSILDTAQSQIAPHSDVEGGKGGFVLDVAVAQTPVSYTHLDVYKRQAMR